MNRSLSLPLLVLLAGLSCTKKITQAGGLELILMSDVPASDLNKVHLEISQETTPGVWHKLLDYERWVPREVSLPTTASIAAGESPNQGALIIFTGLKETLENEQPVVRKIVQRVVQTQVPTDRVAELKILLTVPCVDKVTACPVGESCQPATGTCGSNAIDVAALPTFTPADVPDASGVCGESTCSIGAQCANDNSTQIQICSAGANGCPTLTTMSCPAGQVCEGSGTASCADPSWAAWPVPNSQSDVTNGAPNLESYTDNGNGTVTDNVTGLMWQQATAGALPQADAIVYCKGLTLGGYSGWRLPTKSELVSLLDYGRLPPMIEVTAFPNTPVAFQQSIFWSSTPVVDMTSRAWFVDFSDADCSVAYTSDSAMQSVRCVR